MKRVVDVFKNRGRELVWTYVIHLQNDEDFHPGQLDFEVEALRLSQIDKRGIANELSAKVRLNNWVLDPYGGKLPLVLPMLMRFIIIYDEST